VRDIVHSLLQRQLRRYLDGVDLTREPWPAFLASVDRSYREADADRELVESAMEVSSAELLQANAELRGLVQVFPDLILHIDAAGVITARRGRSVRGFAAARGGLVGQALRGFFDPAEAPAFDAALAAARDTGAVATVLWTGRDGSDEVLHEMRLAALGEHGGVIAIVRDVTDARRAEQLRLARDGAEAASRAKSAFLANMSHELRTPLNAILGYSELLTEDAPAAMRDDLQRIHRSGRSLLQLLNAMLEVARIDAGMVQVEPDTIGASAVAAAAVARVRPHAEAKGLTLECHDTLAGATVETDHAKLTHVLVILLENAVKFTDHGTVAITAAAAPLDGRPGVAFAVRDAGIGIPSDHVARLFQDFAQVDESTTRRHGGLGIGLALARRLATLLGGQLQVDSVLGEGSTFSVWVPSAHAVSPSGESLAVTGGVA
jgi:signal transduction histidine kinase